MEYLKRFMFFVAKMLIAGTIFTFIEEFYFAVKNKLAYKWRTRGINKEEYETSRAELFYKQHGKQCIDCTSWIPRDSVVCPVCEKGEIFRYLEDPTKYLT